VGATVDVVMDGDPDGVVVQAAPLFADLSVADRVMVLFDPPRGVFVVGTVGRAHQAGTVVLRLEYPSDFIDDDTVLVQGVANLQAGRRYRIQSEAIVSYVSGGVNTEQLVQWLGVTFYSLGVSPLEVLGLGGNVYGNDSLAGREMYIANDDVFTVNQSVVSPVTWELQAIGGEIAVDGSVTITDVGPAGT